MTDEQHENESGDSPNFRIVRERMEALEAENATLMSALRVTAFKEAGLDPEVGANKAIYRTYEGQPDPAAIRAFAEEEYGIKVAEEEVVSQAQANADTVAAHAVPAGGQSALAQADQAAAQGDWKTAMALKDAELRRIANAKFGF